MLLRKLMKSPRPVALSSGYHLHWYTLEEIIGQGGFAITYRAHDNNLNQKVAIKEFYPREYVDRDRQGHVVANSVEGSSALIHGKNRFLEEGRTLARFDHPTIVRVLAVFEENNSAYLVMRYEEGQDLQTTLRARNTLDEESLWGIARALANGLSLVHREGFIHRDIKPANLYIRSDRSPVLLDFGAAREAIGNATKTLTALVSPGYAPIEQYRRDGGAQGPWTDIYGLAATLYRAAFGAPPDDAVRRTRSVLEYNRDSLVSPRELSSGRFSHEFCGLLVSGLKLNPNDRPKSVDEWINPSIKTTIFDPLGKHVSNRKTAGSGKLNGSGESTLGGFDKSLESILERDALLNRFNRQEKEPVTPYLIGGSLTLWAYVAWRLNKRLSSYLESRRKSLSDASKAAKLELVGPSSRATKLYSFVLDAAAPIYFLNASVALAWIAATILTGDLFIFGGLDKLALIFSVIFYANSAVFAISFQRKIERFEEEETTTVHRLFDDHFSRESFPFEFRSDIIGRERVTLFLMALLVLPIAQVGLLQRAYSGLIGTLEFESKHYWMIFTLFFVLVGTAHYWGVRALVGLLNTHFDGEQLWVEAQKRNDEAERTSNESVRNDKIP